MKLKISACVIAKNEASNLGRWLASVQPIADEMIVVDTGSTDATEEIARQGGATVYHFAWCNDFSAAKNFALGHAKGDWVLFLDADEFFSKDSIAKVRPLLRRIHKNRRTAGVLCRLVNINLDDGGRRMTSLVQLRMFRRAPHLRYEGSVHETLTLPKGSNLELAQDIEILHTGYSASIVKKKMERNLVLLQQRIAEHGGKEEPVDARYFMDIYYGLGQYDRAEAYAKKLLAMKNLAADLAGRAYETWASCLMKKHAPEEETAACYEAARRACPELAEFPFMQGLWDYDRGDWLGAEQALEDGLAIHARYHGQPTSITAVMDNAAYLLPNVWWRLGCLREAHRDFAGAQDAYVAGLSLSKHHEGLFTSFWAYLRRIGAAPADVIAVLRGIYDEQSPEDMQFLAQRLGRARAGQVYLYYRKRAGDHAFPALAYLAAGRMDAAAETAKSELTAVRSLAHDAEDHGAEGAAALLQVLK